MCKRTVEAHEDLKRQRLQLYTQGPLDHVFGQHRVFPIEDSDLPVWAYLAEVRKEAENDRVCHFIEKSGENNEKNQKIDEETISVDGNSVSSKISQEYIASVMSRLEHEKRLCREEQYINESDEIQLSVGDIDFSVESEGTGDAGKGGEGEGESEGENETEQTEDQEDEDDSEELTENINDASLDTVVEKEIVPKDSSRQPDTSHTNNPVTTEPTETSEEIPGSAAKWREYVFGSSPPPLNYFHAVLDHPTIIKLVVYYTKWLLATMPPTVGEWIFATFVRLDNGLDYRELAIVRDLGRKAHKLRLKLVAANVPYNPTYDMILAIVGDYFGQRDLLE